MHELLVARTGYTGEDGFELYVAPDVAPILWDAHHGDRRGLRPGSRGTRQPRHAAAGGGHAALRPRARASTTYPAQAGLGRVVNLTKDGDFVGRAAVEAGAPTDATRARRTASPRASAPVARLIYARVRRRLARRSAPSPAAPCRRRSATRSPWPTCDPRCASDRHPALHRCPRNARPGIRRFPALL